MKSLLAGLATLTALIFFPTTASADLAFIGRCGSCGVPMYGQTIITGYSRCGTPIFNTVPVGHHCQARRYEQRDYGHQHGYSSSSYGRSAYSGRGDYRGGYGSYGYGRSGGCESRPRVGFSFSISR